VARDVLGRYRGSFGGMFWTILNPLLLMVTYFFVFGIVLRTRFANVSVRQTHLPHFEITSHTGLCGACSRCGHARVDGNLRCGVSRTDTGIRPVNPAVRLRGPRGQDEKRVRRSRRPRRRPLVGKQFLEPVLGVGADPLEHLA
jgi:hypothetical protein